ncbi:Hypothetical protein MVR_LOCUS388 [uncultured virus]|nr:Hypothetical protein MVR_LOCUS388 [uncultured virus]
MQRLFEHDPFHIHNNYSGALIHYDHRDQVVVLCQHHAQVLHKHDWHHIGKVTNDHQCAMLDVHDSRTAFPNSAHDPIAKDQDKRTDAGK